MIFVPGGTFRMGSDAHYKEEAPAHQVKVDGFFIDRTPVTNRQFKEFVKATGHVTIAERVPDAKDYPGALPHMLFAGSLVFKKVSGPVDLRNPTGWWDFVEGANWKRAWGNEFAPAGRQMANTWQGATDWWSGRHPDKEAKSCCIPQNPRGGPEVDSFDERQPAILIPRKVVKGGSHLCAPNYCRRYRPAARHAQPVDTSMSHVGFRCIKRLEQAS
jgi:formylglycine-generating enzyme required for sulfatase activity